MKEKQFTPDYEETHAPVRVDMTLTEKEVLEQTGPTENLSYYESKLAQGQSGIPQRYVFSNIDEAPKRSDEYRDCIGLVVTGTHKETGAPISLMTHQSMSSAEQPNFETDLRKALHEFAAQVEPESVRATIFGGYAADGRTPSQGYESVVETTKKIASEVLPVVPTVLPPKQEKIENAILNTKTGILYLLRSND